MIARTMLIAFTSGVMTLVPMSMPNLPTQRLPIYGGSSGTAFTRDCGSGRVLTGIRGRSGMVLDAIGLLCRPVLQDGTLGPESTVGSLAGGGGGTSEVASCGSGEVVKGVSIAWAVYVQGVTVLCAKWKPSRSFGAGTVSRVLGRATTQYATEYCESPNQPGSGIRGRSGGVVDAVGLNCDEP